MFCGKCGCQNPMNARFCRKCGMAIQQRTAAIPNRAYVPVPNRMQTRTGNRKKAWQIVRLIYWAACSISLFIGLVFYNPDVEQDMPNRIYTKEAAEYYSNIYGDTLNTSWEPYVISRFTFFGHQYLEVREREGEKTRFEAQPKVIVGSALLYAGLYLLSVVVTIVVKVNSKNSGKRQSFS